MDLLTALKILLRQWPVVLFGLALTTVSVVQVGDRVGPTYEATGTVLLLSPGADTNPYLDFGPNLEVAADSLMVVLQSPAGVARLETAGATADFELARIGGPLIDITATGSTAAEATTTVHLVVTALRDELDTAQATAPDDQRITVNELTRPVPEAKLGSRIRAQLAVGALGLVCAVASALAIDAIRQHRRAARAERDTTPASGADGASATGDDPQARNERRWTTPQPTSRPAGGSPTSDRPAPSGVHGVRVAEPESDRRRALPSIYPARPPADAPGGASRSIADQRRYDDQHDDALGRARR